MVRMSVSFHVRRGRAIGVFIELHRPSFWVTPERGRSVTHHSNEGGPMVGAIILGIVAGYLGRLLMPGRDKMGFIATMLLGLAGAVVGFLIFTELLVVGDDRMFDLGGLIGAILGVILLLVLYRA